MCQNGLKTMIYEGKSTYVQTLNQKINIFKQITDSESENVLKMYIFETLKQHSFIPTLNQLPQVGYYNLKSSLFIFCNVTRGTTCKLIPKMLSDAFMRVGMCLNTT